MVNMNGTIKVTVIEEKDIPVAACPFCGYSNFLGLIKTYDYAYRVICKHCNAQGPTSESQQCAVANWNERH